MIEFIREQVKCYWYPNALFTCRFGVVSRSGIVFPICPSYTCIFVVIPTVVWFTMLFIRDIDLYLSVITVDLLLSV